MRWFCNKPPKSIHSWEDLVEQFTSHFQSMEAPVKIEHLRLCRRENNETFEKYVTKFRTLVSKMRDTPELQEVIKICAMNADLTTYFLTGAFCKTFDELFDKVLSYEELERKKTSFRTSKANVNVTSNNYDNKRDNPPSHQAGSQGGSPPRDRGATEIIFPGKSGEILLNTPLT